MADNLVLNNGSGGSTLSTDEVTRATVVQHVQYVKLMNGTDAAIDVIPGDATNGLDVDVTRVSGNVSVVGPAADGAAVSGNPVRIAGSDGTNTQDISTTTSGHVHIHDGGNSITVDGTVSVSGAVDTELTTADLDTGAGTDTRAVVGVVMAASGGGVLAPGDATNGLDVDVTRVSGNVTVVNGGTFATQAAQSGTWTVQPGNTANTTAWLTTQENVHTFDADSGAGTDTTPAMGIAVAASGGAAVITGDATNGLDVDVTRVSGNVTVVNGGTFATQVDGAALTALQLLDDTVKTDDAAFTPATDKVLMIGAQADETAPDSLDEGDAGALRMTLDRLLKVLAARESSVIYDGGVACTVKRAKISAAAAGENTLVAAVVGKKIRVISCFLMSNGNVDAYFNNATDGGICGDATNKLDFQQSVGFVLNENASGWFQTGTANEALRLNLSAAIAVAGSLTYIEVN